MAIKRMGFAEKKWSLLITINGGLTGMVKRIFLNLFLFLDIDKIDGMKRYDETV
jgi:hypothetical protein